VWLVRDMEGESWGLEVRRCGVLGEAEEDGVDGTDDGDDIERGRFPSDFGDELELCRLCRRLEELILIGALVELLLAGLVGAIKPTVMKQGFDECDKHVSIVLWYDASWCCG
jgi:hypothetical protein